jgi:hypothetical protein
MLIKNISIAFVGICVFLVPASGSANVYSMDVLKRFADLVVATTAVPPPELNDPQLSAATKEFGSSEIPISKLPFESEMAVAQQQPWSSWWFPHGERELIAGDDKSTAGKFDAFRSTVTGRPSFALKTEQERLKGARDRWEGLCDAWSVASLLEPEPVVERAFELDGGLFNYQKKYVSFTVGEQKALLLKTYEATPASGFKMYGQKFTGDANGWIHPDIFPQEMHRLIEVQLFQRKQALIMDHDPGREIWSEPVFKANYRVEAVNGRDDAVYVRMWLYSAAPFRQEEKDKVGRREVVREYNYFLYGTRTANGTLKVTSGAWAKGELVDSRVDHPDYFIVPTQNLRRLSANREIDPQIVDQIIGR